MVTIPSIKKKISYTKSEINLYLNKRRMNVYIEANFFPYRMRVDVEIVRRLVEIIF